MGNLEFRVWDKEEGKFFEPIYRAYKGELLDISISLCGELLRRSMACCSEHQSNFPDRYEIDQFTDRIDIHGTKIFSNDIIRYIVNNEGDERVVVNKVEYNADCAGFKPLCHHNIIDEDGWYSYVISNIEVIGHFREHPELLKSK